MKLSLKRLVCLLCILLAGSATTDELGERVPGETVASPKLQRDTLDSIRTFEMMRDCTDWKVVNTEVIEPLNAGDDMLVKQLYEAALTEDYPVLRERLWEEYRKYRYGQSVERWTVDGCGTLVRYRVVYTADGRDGTNYSVNLEK